MRVPAHRGESAAGSSPPVRAGRVSVRAGRVGSNGRAMQTVGFAALGLSRVQPSLKSILE